MIVAGDHTAEHLVVGGIFIEPLFPFAAGIDLLQESIELDAIYEASGEYDLGLDDAELWGDVHSVSEPCAKTNFFLGEIVGVMFF